MDCLLVCMFVQLFDVCLCVSVVVCVFVLFCVFLEFEFVCLLACLLVGCVLCVIYRDISLCGMFGWFNWLVGCLVDQLYCIGGCCCCAVVVVVVVVV